MGYRTVVMLNNDFTNEWSKDPKLGEKIARAMNYTNHGDSDMASLGNHGQVVQCVHADTQSLVILDGYSIFANLSNKNFSSHQSATDDAVELLKQAADKLGYKLAKKPKPTVI